MKIKSFATAIVFLSLYCAAWSANPRKRTSHDAELAAPSGKSKRVTRHSLDKVPSPLEVAAPESPSKKMSQAMGRLDEDDLKYMEAKLAETWDTDQMPGNTVWGYETEYKCSPVVGIAFKSRKGGVRSKIVDKLVANDSVMADQCPRLTACLFSNMIFPTSSDQELDPGALGTLARLGATKASLKKLRTLPSSPRFREHLSDQINSSMTAIYGEMLKNGQFAELNSFVDDFEMAWSMRVLFSAPEVILNSANLTEAIEFLKVLDYKMATDFQLSQELLKAALLREDKDLVKSVFEAWRVNMSQYKPTVDFILENCSVEMIKYLKSINYGDLLVDRLKICDVAASTDRIDLIQVMMEADPSFSCLDSYLPEAFSQGSASFVQFMEENGEVHLPYISLTVSNALKSEDDKGIALILEKHPDVFPKIHVQFYEIVSADVMETLFNFAMRDFANSHPEATPQETKDQVAKIIELISCNYKDLLTGNVEILDWIRAKLQEHGLEFPVLTKKQIQEMMSSGQFPTLEWYAKFSGHKLHNLDEILNEYRRTRGLNPEACAFFLNQGVPILQDDVVGAFEDLFYPRYDVDIYWTVSRAFPDLFGGLVTEKAVCQALRVGNYELLDWIISVSGDRFTGIHCDHIRLTPEHLATYELANTKLAGFQQLWALGVSVLLSS